MLPCIHIDPKIRFYFRENNGRPFFKKIPAEFVENYPEYFEEIEEETAYGKLLGICLKEKDIESWTTILDDSDPNIRYMKINIRRK